MNQNAMTSRAIFPVMPPNSHTTTSSPRGWARAVLRAPSNQGQYLRWHDAHLLEDPPAGDLQAVAEEGAQGATGQLHGRAAELLLLAQEQKVGAQLILSEGGRIAVVMLAELAHVADVFVLGGLAIIFELDKVRELCDGRMDSMFHRWRVCPWMRCHTRRQIKKL